MSLAWWLNTAWMLKCGGESRAFRRATRAVAATQAAVLADILGQNRDTEFGRVYGFAGIRSARAYQERVPLSRYDYYAAAVERIAAGQTNVLTREPTLLLEPTSGTTGGEKLIPYTAGLRRGFQRAVAAWIADLFRHRSAVRGGRAYWSISPALGGPRRSSAGIPIGFDDDAAYLGTLERMALDRLLVVPPAVARFADLDAFRYRTLFHLLAAPDLALISVWNPTFLSALLAPLETWAERLTADLRRQDAKRAAHVERVFRSRLTLPEKMRLLWPRLALISCWTDAAAARCLDEVRDLFPAVEIQPKGLLATEGCVSFPLVDRPAPVLAVRSHFFEFQGDGGACRLAHELNRGGRYRVVLTTAGGLYRYQLGDEMEVAGFENECPLLRFLGKADSVSDLVGEKLSEPHVRAVLERVLAAAGLTPQFALLVPVAGRPSRYRLYVQTAAAVEGLQAPLEAGLAENPYYRQAVALGQLAPVEVRQLDPDGEPGWRVYERVCLARGQRAGNIKPTALVTGPDWADVWEGREGISLAGV
jgi:hypothetical protein